MKKALVILGFASLVFFGFRETGSDEPVPVPFETQKEGDAAKGYQYLITGDFLKSGVPYGFWTLKNGKASSNLLNREGRNATVEHGYNVISNAEGIEMVIPTCLQCHSQVMDGKLVMGLGNTTLDFTNTQQYKSNPALKILAQTAPKQYQAGKPFFRAFTTVYPQMETEVRGVNTADRLAMLLVAHRDPNTLEWKDEPMLKIPDGVIPTDVPAWWLMKKKNAMFYTGFGRGDFTRFLMLSNILTVKDTVEAREVSSHFGDVLAYIRSLKAPAYPLPVNKEKAKQGALIFNENCSRCHGTYGKEGQYPNLLIPAGIIGTDSLLYKSNQQYADFLAWFRKSWFAQGDHPARLEPFDGYIAPPLDGVWVTAPYFHNGSVPTLEAVLNSEARPKYWSRDFEKAEYDYANPGWKYQAHDKPEAKKTYNTTLPGYGNYGHYFGDALSNSERKAVVEYLKTL